MYVLSWFDNRTLIACDFLLAIIFATVFFCMKRVYPALRGVEFVAMSFLLGVPGTVLIASRGNISYFVSVTVANAFIFGSFVLLYRGVCRFIGSRRGSLIPLAVSIVSLGVLTYNSQIRENIVARIVAISLTIALIRGMIAVELFRKSSTFTSPTTMRLFAGSMSFFAAVSLNRAVMTFLYGAPSNFLQTNIVQTTTLLLGVVSICLTGLFILILSNSELIARSRDESQKDALSGAFNRRGIEAKLAMELKHLSRGRQKLSIALIDLDHFKSINDVSGHAAGDAALRDVAEAISSRLRGRDHLGRYGGDEFLLVLPQTAASIALVIAERMSHAVNELSVSGRCQQITLSIGITEAVADDDAVSLTARADKALYLAKSEGRNCWRMIKANDVLAESEDPAKDGSLGGMLMPAIESTLIESTLVRR
jgi:diguanylate cyclase (GGDEF)-like protein